MNMMQFITIHCSRLPHSAKQRQHTMQYNTMYWLKSFSNVLLKPLEKTSLTRIYLDIRFCLCLLRTKKSEYNTMQKSTKHYGSVKYTIDDANRCLMTSVCFYNRMAETKLRDDPIWGHDDNIMMMTVMWQDVKEKHVSWQFTQTISKHNFPVI